MSEVDEASVGVVLGHADENQTLCLFDARLSVVVDLIMGPGWVELGANDPLVDGLSNGCAQVDIGMVENKYATRKEMLWVGEVKVKEGVNVGGSEGGGLLAEDAVVEGAGTGPEEVSMEAIEAWLLVELLVNVKALARAMLVLGDEVAWKGKTLHGGL